MPQGAYEPNDLVYIYDLAHMKFGTVTHLRQWRDIEDNVRHETIGVLILGRSATVVCAPTQLRRALWTFLGPTVVPGDDVIPTDLIKETRNKLGAPQHMHIEHRPWEKIKIW